LKCLAERHTYAAVAIVVFSGSNLNGVAARQFHSIATGLAAGLYNEGMKSRGRKTVSYSVFYEQAAEGGYVASVPALPGCHTQGENLEEAEANVKEAIALYLESLAAHGDPIPAERPSFQGRVTVAA
jgi:antitoxin HicB